MYYCRALTYPSGGLIFPYSYYKYKKRKELRKNISLVNEISKNEDFNRHIEKSGYPVSIYGTLKKLLFNFFLRKKRIINKRRVLSEAGKRHICRYRVRILSSDRVLQIRSCLRNKDNVF